MNASPAASEIIRHFEGCRLTAYPDPATNAAPFTIGYGCTFGVKQGDTITQDMADLMLLRDIKRFEGSLNSYIKADVTQCQFDALISLVFNIGMGNFASSTLLKMINAGSADAAASQFLRWNKAAGREMPGLTKRRTAESLLYQGLDWK
jgi:lysozyme